ncbi:MAG: T9SS type A sorting domain-containing protein [Chitinophagales bacterium]|nr:T9SS type A sorting domain-containing protein [Chitinophagales bacterium]
MSTAGLHATEGFVAKYTSSGSFVWVVKFGESAAYDAGVRDFIFDSNNNLYAVGYFSGTIDLAPGSSTSNFTSNGCGDIFLVKLDNNRNYVWGFNIGGSECDYSMSIGIDATNNVYLTGTISSQNIDFDPGAGVANLNSTSVGDNDAFIAKYNNNGLYIYAFTLGSSGADAAYHVLVQDAAFTVVGSFSTTIDADPGLGVQNLTSSGLQDIFVIRYALDGTLLNAYQFGSSSSNDCAYGITENENHVITFVGTFGGTNVDFDPSSGQALLSSSDGYDAFFASFNFNSSLPATLTSFSALQKGKDVVLNWAVTNEINVAYYDIEYSKDNTRFSSIGTIPAKKGSAEIAYTKTHYGVSNGTHFYRIKTVDKDGKFVYSNIIRIEITTPNELLIYPNPATTDKIKIRYNAVSNAKYNAVIINANGQIVRQKNLFEMMNEQDIYIGNLANGIYTIRLIDDKGNTSTTTFIKAN